MRIHLLRRNRIMARFCSAAIAGCLSAVSLAGCDGEADTFGVSESLAGEGEAGASESFAGAGEAGASESHAGEGEAGASESLAGADSTAGASGAGQGLYTSARSITASEMFTERDFDGGYDGRKAEEIALSEGDVILSEEGVYLLHGTMTDGTVIVDAGKDDKVQLVFDGVEIENDADAAVWVKQADKVFITLAEGSDNFLTSRGYVSSEDNGIDGVIYAKSDLVVNGTGALTVNAVQGHGIVSRDDLKITGGTVTVTAQKQGLSGKDSVRIGGGVITITSGRDSIHAENDEDADKGYVYIGDGMLKLISDGDGISAGSALQADGGTVEITAGGGSGNRTAAVDENGETVSTKGIKASGELAVNGGIFVVDSQDDAIHSDQDVTINGGVLSLATGDDGIHADGTAAVTGGNIQISDSYEGIEGNNVEISGGNISLYATDDGLNAAGGNDSSGFGGMFGGGERFGGNEGFAGGGGFSGNEGFAGGGEFGGNEGFAGGGGFGGNEGFAGGGGFSGNEGFAGDGGFSGNERFSRDEGAGGTGFGAGEAGDDGNDGTGSTASHIKISGGVIHIRADGDGIDSNGDLMVSGGKVYVSGPENGANGALDYDGTGQITGGIVVAAGSRAMAMNFGDSSTQGSILITLSAHPAGTTIALMTSGGKELVNYTAECEFDSVVISCPDLALGESYIVTAGEESFEVTLSDSIIYGSGFDMGGFGNGLPGGGGHRFPDGEGNGFPDGGGRGFPDGEENGLPDGGGRGFPDGEGNGFPGEERGFSEEEEHDFPSGHTSLQ